MTGLAINTRSRVAHGARYFTNILLFRFHDFSYVFKGGQLIVCRSEG
jgi:hypothetical protein